MDKGEKKMAVIAKLKGKKMVCGTEKPLEGTITVYDYIVKHSNKCSSLSIINYYAKDTPNMVSTTRFDFVIGDSSNVNNYAVSPRIIAKKQGNKVLYTVEFLATYKGQIVLDIALGDIERKGFAKNGSDLFVLDKDSLLFVLKELFKNGKALR